MIRLTDEEKAKVKSGELTVQDIIEQRGQATEGIPQPDSPEPKQDTELDQVKRELRETNVLYKEAIAENRRLRDALKENVQLKATLRAQIETLRKRKKELMED